MPEFDFILQSKGHAALKPFEFNQGISNTLQITVHICLLFFTKAVEIQYAIALCSGSEFSIHESKDKRRKL